MICKNCNTKLDTPGTKNCPACGEPIETKEGNGFFDLVTLANGNASVFSSSDSENHRIEKLEQDLAKQKKEYQRLREKLATARKLVMALLIGCAVSVVLSLVAVIGIIGNSDGKYVTPADHEKLQEQVNDLKNKLQDTSSNNISDVVSDDISDEVISEESVSEPENTPPEAPATLAEMLGASAENEKLVVKITCEDKSCGCLKVSNGAAYSDLNEILDDTKYDYFFENVKNVYLVYAFDDSSAALTLWCEYSNADVCADLASNADKTVFSVEYEDGKAYLGVLVTSIQITYESAKEGLPNVSDHFGIIEPSENA